MGVEVSVALTGLHLTEDEYLELCHEDVKAELIGGVLVVSTPASVRHEAIQGFLQAVLRFYIEAEGLGMVLGSRTPMRFKGDYFEPDLLFVARDRLDRLGAVFLDGPADVAVEISSPDSGALDRVIKRRAYEAGGVREYWLIDPEHRQAEFYRLDGEGRYRLILSGEAGKYESEAIAGFWLMVEWLWQEPLPRVPEVLRGLGLIK